MSPSGRAKGVIRQKRRSRQGSPGWVSAWKPDPGLFAHALERLEIAPEQAIYVGDNYYADVIGARRAGLGPVLYDPDQVFPDADCPVIRSIGELRLLKSDR